MKRIAFIVFLFILISDNLFSQEIKFFASVQPKVLRIGETFQLQYTLNQEIKNIQIPSFDDFRFIGGPYTQQSISMNYINGKIARNIEMSYIYSLQATKAGKFTIQPAKIKFKGKDISSNTVVVEVIAVNDKTSNTETNGEEIFVRLLINKSSVYLGEQITATVKFYTKINISGFGSNYKGPEFNGFYSQEVDAPQLKSLEPENVSGEVYYTGIVQKFIIYPQKSGVITIKPFELVANVPRNIKRQSNGDFDDFFQRFENVPRTLASRSVNITVKPLPVDKPESFTGAVGEFSIKSSINKTQLTTNDAATYKIIISGKGNIKLIDQPQVSIPQDIEFFDPKTNIVKNNELSGSKSFEFVLIPRYAGIYQIPSVLFSYFDPEKKCFITCKTEEYVLNVTKGNEDSTALVVNALSKEDFKLLSSDILFIKNKPFKVYKIHNFIFDSLYFYLTYIVSSILFIGFLIAGKQHIKRNLDITKVQTRRARQNAGKRLKKAHHFLKHGLNKYFYEEISKALWDYISHKLSIPLAELTKDKATLELMNKKVDDGLIQQFNELLNKCEYTQFAPGAKEVSMENIYNRAVEIITRFEQKIKY